MWEASKRGGIARTFRRVHIPKTVGSNPSPATSTSTRESRDSGLSREHQHHLHDAIVVVTHGVCKQRLGVRDRWFKSIHSHSAVFDSIPADRVTRRVTPVRLVHKIAGIKDRAAGSGACHPAVPTKWNTPISPIELHPIHPSQPPDSRSATSRCVQGSTPCVGVAVNRTANPNDSGYRCQRQTPTPYRRSFSLRRCESSPSSLPTIRGVLIHSANFRMEKRGTEPHTETRLSVPAAHSPCFAISIVGISAAAESGSQPECGVASNASDDTMTRHIDSKSIASNRMHGASRWECHAGMASVTQKGQRVKQRASRPETGTLRNLSIVTDDTRGETETMRPPRACARIQDLGPYSGIGRPKAHPYGFVAGEVHTSRVWQFSNQSPRWAATEKHSGGESVIDDNIGACSPVV